jgi:hypothetical protein
MLPYRISKINLSKYAKLAVFTLLLLGPLINSTTNITQIAPAAAPDNTVNDPLLDPNQWVITPHGDAQVTRDPGVTITSSPNYDFSGADVVTTWQFRGDFDVQIECRMAGWEGEYES